MFRAFKVFWVVLFVLSLMAAPVHSVSAADSKAQYMPPNPDKILTSLIQQGVIPANAKPDEQEAALDAYLQLKLKGGMDKGANPQAALRVQENEEALNLSSGDIRGKKLGSKYMVGPSQAEFKPLEGADKLLLILVEFSETPYTWTTSLGTERTEAGPLHNQMPEPSNDFDLWVPDFSTQHYEDMLFTPGGWTMPEDAPRYAGNHYGSMADYYTVQSYGKYTVEGKAYGWFTVDKPEAYYGDDNTVDGGNDNLRPGTTKDLIADAVQVVNDQAAINWEEYDMDANCVIDHPLFIHAGVDQSGGGGLQGDDAIWAHSSSVHQQVAVTETCPDGLFIDNYTIMPEDGGVGVFAHEFGHDLGLPDEYDTIYSGRGDSVGFWSLMSSGSWIGRPAQTQPSDISIWGRYALGWLTPGENMAVVKATDLTKTPLGVRLEQAERWGGEGTLNALRISLPAKYFYVNTPYSGEYEWFGGKADEIDTTLTRTVDLTGKTSATLSFATWYDIEEDWDFGFVQVSTDGGATFTSLPIAGTTDTAVPDAYPTIFPNLPGFTGNSGGWQLKTFDLSAYAGQVIELRFRYITDWGTSLEGFFVDDISVTADGAVVFSDDVETEDAAWTAAGWTRDMGYSYKTHYYIMEYRNLLPFETWSGFADIVNFDAGLQNAYSYDPYALDPNQPEYFSYAPGLLLWYRDFSYTDNWTGAHPGHGFLLVVDAHKQPLLRPGTGGYGSLPWSSRVQTYDAPFSLFDAPSFTLPYWGKWQTQQGLNAVPNFDDKQSYWSSAAPAASVITPTYGVKFRVLGEADDRSAVLIGLGK